MLLRKLALEPLFFFPGDTVKGPYILTSFRGCVLSWLTTLHLDRGNDQSFDIYYCNFPMGNYLKHFINVYRCVCWMKSMSIDGPDVPYIRPCKNRSFFFARYSIKNAWKDPTLETFTFWNSTTETLICYVICYTLSFFK